MNICNTFSIITPYDAPPIKHRTMGRRRKCVQEETMRPYRFTPSFCLLSEKLIVFPAKTVKWRLEWKAIEVSVPSPWTCVAPHPLPCLQTLPHWDNNSLVTADATVHVVLVKAAGFPYRGTTQWHRLPPLLHSFTVCGFFRKVSKAFSSWVLLCRIAQLTTDSGIKQQICLVDKIYFIFQLEEWNQNTRVYFYTCTVELEADLNVDAFVK